MPRNPMQILVIYRNAMPLSATRLTMLHHLRALEYSDPQHQITYYNCGEAGSLKDTASITSSLMPSELTTRGYDGVVLHYSFLSMRNLGLPFYVWKRRFEWIRDLQCPKVAIPQDEGSFAAVLDEWLCELGVSAILSVHYAPTGPLYPIMRERANILRCLPGYIDEGSADEIADWVLPIRSRATDIVYRARRLPYHVGSAGSLKAHVADVIAARAGSFGLTTDISTREEDVVRGSDWLAFLASGRAVIGAEGGYSAIDWHGETRAQMREILKADPTLAFEEASARMPTGWDSYRLLTITPRHFEAIMARTCQVLVEGEYSGILESERHYIPLRRDCSNVAEVLAQLRDHDRIQRMVDRCYRDICQSGDYTYRKFAKLIENALLERRPAEEMVRTVKSGQERHRELEILERQIIAERHYSVMLQAMLPDLLKEIVDRTPRRVADFLWSRALKLVKRILLGFAAVAVVGVGAYLAYHLIW